MFFVVQNQLFIVSSILLIFYGLILPAELLRIENCETDWVTIVLGRDPQNTLRYKGRINAELAWNKTHGVAAVNQIVFSGATQYQLGPIENLTLNVNLKAVRVQRLIEYGRVGFEDVVNTQCSLGFLYDDNISLPIHYELENAIILDAESCIEKEICDFHPESHRIGDDIHVKSKFRKNMLQTTTQGTVNAVADFVVDTLINSLMKANKTLLSIPQFDVSVSPVSFSSSGGAVDILQYIKRDKDFSFRHEGRRYVIDTTLSLTGGQVELNNVSLTSSLANFVDGQLPVNMTGSTLRMIVALDYNQSPCKISASDVTLNVPPNQVNFSALKIKVLGFEVTNVETVLNTLFVKSLTVYAIAGKLAGVLGELVEGLNCEDYRDLLFKI